MKTMKRKRNPDRKGMEAARAWGDEGELAYETQEMVRAAIEDVGIPTTELIYDGDGVTSSCSPNGIDIWARFVVARGIDFAIALPPSWRSIYVFPPQNLGQNDVALIDAMDRALAILQRDAAYPGFEWFWDVVDMGNMPRIVEFSLGPIPWRWMRRVDEGLPVETTLILFDGGYPQRGASQGGDPIAKASRFQKFHPILNAIEEAVRTRQNLLVIGRGAGTRFVRWAMRMMFPIAKRQRPQVIEIPANPDRRRGAISHYVWAAAHGILELEEVPDFTAADLRRIKQQVGRTEPLDRPIVLGFVDEGVYENPALRAKCEEFGFPIVIETPDEGYQAMDSRDADPDGTPYTAADVRDRIAHARIEAEETMTQNPSRRNPAKLASYTPQKVVAKLKRDLDLRIPKGTVVGSPRDLVAFCLGYMDLATEMFVVIFMNVRNEVVGYQEMASGGTAGVEVHVSGIFQAALLAGAAAFVTMHNHPSGNVAPSTEDRALWRRIREAGTMMGVPVIDNLVIGINGRYYSESESEGV